MEEKSFLPMWAVCLLCPLSVVGLLVQKFMTLKGPTEEKLIQTTEDLKEFIEEVGLYKNGFD